jgi:hypothetical protein
MRLILTPVALALAAGPALAQSTLILPEPGGGYLVVSPCAGGLSAVVGPRSPAAAPWW